MVESIAPIAPAIAVPPVQAAQSPVPAASATEANGISASALNAFEQSIALQNEAALLNVTSTSASQSSAANISEVSNTGALEGAAFGNLSPQALIALSETNNSAPSVNAVGNLTPVQLEEIATLENDAQILNATETTTFSSDVSLLDTASTVNLSPQAVDILNGINAGTSVSAGNTLTTAQLQQIAGIIAPFISEPLTQTTLTQIQTALTTAGFNPMQLSLQNIFLSQSYVAELMPVTSLDAEQLAVNEMTTELLDT